MDAEMDENHKEIRAGRGLAAILANMGGGGANTNATFKMPAPPRAKPKVQQQAKSQGFDLNSLSELSSWDDLGSKVQDVNSTDQAKPKVQQQAKSQGFDLNSLSELSSVDGLGSDVQNVNSTYQGHKEIRAGRGLAAILANMGGGGANTNATFKVPAPPKAKPKVQQQAKSQGFDLNSPSDLSSLDDLGSKVQDVNSTDQNHKEIRAGRGLAAILANMGGGGANTNATFKVPAPPRGFRSKSSPLAVKRDAPKNDEDSGNKKHKQGEDGTSTNAGKTSSKEDDKKPADNSSKPNHDETVVMPMALNSWSDLMQFNDEHDQEWCDNEQKRLDESYGEKIITLKYISNQPGKLGYYCELCSSEMHSDVSLDLHCGGMKHFKRKTIAEKLMLDPSQNNEAESKYENSDGPPSKQKKKQGSKSQTPLERRSSSPGRRSLPFRNDRDRRRIEPYGSAGDGYRERSPVFKDRYDRGGYGRQCSPVGDRRPLGNSRCRTPPPPNISDWSAPTPMLTVDDKTIGATGLLLKKVAGCSVNNSADEDLASEVITLLLKALTDFYQKKESYSSVHLITETEIKFNIVKELQKRSQMERGSKYSNVQQTIENFISNACSNNQQHLYRK